MANKVKTDKQSGGVNVGGNAKARNIIGRDYRVTVISVGAAFIIVAGIAAIVLLSPIINKPPIPPAPSPTPFAFEPAELGETLLIVVDFDDKSAGYFSGIDPAQRIYNLIAENQLDSNIRLRIEQYHHPLIDTAEARRLLNTYRATLVLWGSYDKFSVQLQIELDKERISLSNPKSREFSLATPESIPFRFTVELPSQSSYIAFFALGMMVVNTNHDTAMSLFTRAIISATQKGTDSINPWEALTWRGNIYSWSGEHEEAVKDYSEALKIHPHQEGYNNRAISYWALGKYDEAIADYTKALEIDLKYKEAYFGRAIAYESQGKHDAAIADYTKAIQIDSKYREAYLNRARIYEALGEHDAAIADYTQSFGFDLKSSEVHAGFGEAYRLQGKYDAAIAEYTLAIATSPKYKKAYVNRGTVYWYLQLYDAAIADYSKAIEIDSNDQIAFNHRGAVLLLQGKYDEAIIDCARAIEIDPKLADAYKCRGEGYALSGKLDMAIADYQESIRLNSDPYTYCVMGIAYTRMGDFPPAITVLEQGVKLDTKSEYSWCKTALDNARLGIPTP